MATEMPLDWQERRWCARCGQVDDHPRHNVGVVAGSGDKPASFHTDCHALLGCPVCLHQLERAENAHGLDLRDRLIELGPVDDDTIAELLAQPAAKEG